jgi:Family of unknown function (DUF6186)
MSTRDLILAVWTVLGVCVVGCGVLSVLRPFAVVTPRVAIGALMSSWPGRVFLVLGWMWLGWHLFAR